MSYRLNASPPAPISATSDPKATSVLEVCPVIVGVAIA